MSCPIGNSQGSQRGQHDLPQCGGRRLRGGIQTRRSYFKNICQLELNLQQIFQFQPEIRGTFNKLAIKYPTEIDASILMKILKHYNCWRSSSNNADLVRPVSVNSNVGPSGCCTNVPCFNSLIGSEKPPSLELCKSLIMLRDFNISGKINLVDVPALLHTLHFWRVIRIMLLLRVPTLNFYHTIQIAFGKYDRTQGGKTSSYNLRPILWESGLTVSNKVLECLVLRFAKNRVLTAEAFIMALVRLHLAHGNCIHLVVSTSISNKQIAQQGICNPSKHFLLGMLFISVTSN